jgi:hypothetical protein
MFEKFLLVQLPEQERVSEMSKSYSAPRGGDRHCQDEDRVERQAGGSDGAQGLSWTASWVIQPDGWVRLLQELHTSRDDAHSQVRILGVWLQVQLRTIQKVMSLTSVTKA